MTTSTNSYTATSSQLNMFLHHVKHPSDTAFDLGFVFRVDGAVDSNRLLKATRAAFSATAAFATTFRHVGDELIALPGTGIARVLECDWSGMPLDRIELLAVEETEKLIASGPINPSSPHQVTGRFYRGQDAKLLSIVASHLVSDAYSFHRVVGVISALYESHDDKWPELLAGLSDHPGTVDPPMIYERSANRYQQLIHSVADPKRLPPTVRDHGRITGSWVRRWIGGPDAESLRASELAREHGLTAALFTSYAYTLSRLVGSGSFDLGLPIAGRAGHRAKEAVGFFVNTLPLPIQMRNGTTWRELCAQVATGIRVLQGVQGLDIRGQVGSTLLPGPRASVDNAVTFYSKDLTLTLEGAEVASLPLRRTDLPYPFTVTFADEGEAIRIDIGVADGFDSFAVADYLMQGISRVTESPDSAIIDGAVWQDASALPESADDAISELTVVDLIRHIAANHPEAIALRSDETVSYAELSTRMLAGAGELDAMEASRLVVVRMEKSIDAVVAILAVLASGRAYVPIDPATPRHRNAHIMNKVAADLDMSPTVLIDGNPSALGEVRGTTITRTPRSLSPVCKPNSADRAYVIFTSGSSGEPKGVVIRHSALSTLLRSAGSTIASGPDDRWCLFHSLAFDFSVWELFGAIASGGSLAIPRPADIAQPDAFIRFIDREGVTVLNQTPSAFRRLTYSLEYEVSSLPSVRVIVFGGEALHPADLRTWPSDTRSRTRFVNMYGITETTVHVTAKEITSHQIEHERRSVIGEPLSHLEIEIIDELGRLAPAGVAGELLVCGTGLAEGYLGEEGLTAERFRWIKLQGRRLRAYRTGDRVRRDVDGELVYLGRLDGQVQLRGYRIEPGEIESAITAVGGTNASTVALVPSEGGREPFLCAWVVPSGPGTEKNLRAELSSILPSYMVPAAIVPLEVIPTTQNGKPDINALVPPTPEENRETDGTLAGRIARVWEEVIGVGRIHTHDRFMEVGGTSMHVMQVHERLRKDLGLNEVAVIDIFEHPTPAALAAHVLNNHL